MALVPATYLKFAGLLPSRQSPRPNLMDFPIFRFSDLLDFPLNEMFGSQAFLYPRRRKLSELLLHRLDF